VLEAKELVWVSPLSQLDMAYWRDWMERNEGEEESEEEQDDLEYEHLLEKVTKVDIDEMEYVSQKIVYRS
jgi:hypothetical protein